MKQTRTAAIGPAVQIRDAGAPYEWRTCTITGMDYRRAVDLCEKLQRISPDRKYRVIDRHGKPVPKEET